MAKAFKSSKSGKVGKSYTTKAAAAAGVSKALRNSLSSKAAKTAVTSASPKLSGSSTTRDARGAEPAPSHPSGFRNWPGVRMTGPLTSRLYVDSNDAVKCAAAGSGHPTVLLPGRCRAGSHRFSRTWFCGRTGQSMVERRGQQGRPEQDDGPR
jgi:hypothetical protein